MPGAMGGVSVGAPAGGGIPQKYLIIGLGAAAVGLLLFLNKGKSAPAASGDNVQPASSVSGMLSSLQQQQLQQYGDITKLFANTNDAIAGVSTHLDTQAQALGNQFVSNLTTGFGTLGAQIGNFDSEQNRNFLNLYSRMINGPDAPVVPVDYFGPVQTAATYANQYALTVPSYTNTVPAQAAA